tara:strand:+ start:140 stop:280 length:141 start_codon:yes stop_codon:yes gene_type:complete
MSKGIDPRLSGEVLLVFQVMEHYYSLIIVDTNFSSGRVSLSIFLGS